MMHEKHIRLLGLPAKDYLGKLSKLESGES